MGVGGFGLGGGAGFHFAAHFHDLESEVFDHLVVIFRGLALGGEVVADEDGVGGVEALRLEPAEVEFASAGDAEFAIGVHEAEHAEGAETIAGGDVVGLLQRGAVDGVQEVDGDGLDLHVTESGGEFDEVIVSFAHADDAAGAEFHTRAADGLESVDAVLVGMGGANFVVESAAGVEVVVDAIDAGVLEDVGLIGGEEAEADADVHAVFVLDFADDVGDVVEFAFVGSAAAGDDAEGAGLGFLGLAGAFEERFFILEDVLGDGGGGEFGLGAVATVFGAEAALGVAEVIELDGGAEIFGADAEGGGEESRDLEIVGGKDGLGLLGGEEFSGQ